MLWVVSKQDHMLDPDTYCQPHEDLRTSALSQQYAIRLITATSILCRPDLVHQGVAEAPQITARGCAGESRSMGSITLNVNLKLTVEERITWVVVLAAAR